MDDLTLEQFLQWAGEGLASGLFVGLVRAAVFKVCRSVSNFARLAMRD